MAIAGFHRLTSQIYSSPSLSLFSKAIFTRSSASSSLTSSPSFSKKVTDRIVKLFAIDPDGKKREIMGLSGQTLLKALANNGLIDPASHRLEDIDACSAECEQNLEDFQIETKKLATSQDSKLRWEGFKSAENQWDWFKFRIS
ncbi:hypothetical protein U1Q18_027333 [Sarracenia purpurea var. burkii]